MPTLGGYGSLFTAWSQAGGFCFVNDVVLAIQKLIRKSGSGSSSSSTSSGSMSSTSTSSFISDSLRKSQRRRKVLYLDLDIHHCDGVQSAFYDSDQVMVVSLHRYTPGFFPSSSGSINEKGKYKTPGVGFNLNIPMYVPLFCFVLFLFLSSAIGTIAIQLYTYIYRIFLHTSTGLVVVKILILSICVNMC